VVIGVGEARPSKVGVERGIPCCRKVANIDTIYLWPARHHRDKLLSHSPEGGHARLVTRCRAKLHSVRTALSGTGTGIRCRGWAEVADPVPPRGPPHPRIPLNSTAATTVGLVKHAQLHACNVSSQLECIIYTPINRFVLEVNFASRLRRCSTRFMRYAAFRVFPDLPCPLHSTRTGQSACSHTLTAWCLSAKRQLMRGQKANTQP
jgi:hypothetical protein